MGGVSNIITYRSLCHIHILLLRELISWESVVDNLDSTKVEVIGLTLKEVVAELYLKHLLTPGKDRTLYSKLIFKNHCPSMIDSSVHHAIQICF